MEDLFRVGERVAQEAEHAAGAGVADFADAKLAELLGGSDADIEQYLQSYEQMLSQGLSGVPPLNQVDSEGGITVKPDPGFVVKTRNTQTGQKVFINITSNEHIEAPHMKTMAELEGEEGVRVPLSVGAPVEDSDKKNEPCLTYDLVANPETVAECQKTPAFRDTVVSLCLAAVAQKYSVELDAKYKLPKMKYKGSVVQLQRIRKKKQSQIQELLGGAKPNAGIDTATTPDVGGSGERSPEFCVFYRRADAPTNVDGFTMDWGALIEETANAEMASLVYGSDLPCYRVNAFQENIRGTMKNLLERQRDEEQAAVAEMEGGEAGIAQLDTGKLLAGRTCVAQVRMPDLDKHVASLKQFRAEVSDECLRVSFPLLPRSGRAAYKPLTIWWPRPFCAVQADAEWDPKLDMLTVSLPTEAPVDATASFDQTLLDAVF